MNVLPKITFTILCSGIVWLAYTWGTANAHYVRVVNQIDSIAAGTTADEISRIETSVEQMLAMHSSHPHYEVTAGTFYENVAYASDNETVKQAYLHHALVSYKTSASHREVWARTWARVFRVKAELGEFDDEFSNAVFMANLYGPKDEGVAKELVFTLLRNWRQFKPEDIKISIQQIGNLRDYARFKHVYDYALLIGETNFLCNLVSVNNIDVNGCKNII